MHIPFYSGCPVRAEFSRPKTAEPITTKMKKPTSIGSTP